MRTVEWHKNAVRMIDQRKIPWESVTVDLETYQAVAESITNMTVRGAPAIGAAAAFGLALAAFQSSASTLEKLIDDLGNGCNRPESCPAHRGQPRLGSR